MLYLSERLEGSSTFSWYKQTGYWTFKYFCRSSMSGKFITTSTCYHFWIFIMFKIKWLTRQSKSNLLQLRIWNLEENLKLLHENRKSEIMNKILRWAIRFRDGSRATATSKKERFVIIVNDFWPLNIITKRSILDVAVTLDPTIRFPKESESVSYFANFFFSYHVNKQLRSR